MVFIDNVDSYHSDEPSLAPVDEDSDPHSPFIGKTPAECHRLLLQLRETTESEIMTEWFAVMDERSERDDTVLLVAVERDDGGENEVLGYRTVRASFEVACTSLMCYESGHSSVDEDLERAARQPDGVYRGPK